MSTTVRVLLCDDHKIVREGLKMVLADDPAVQVVAEADTGSAVLDAVQTLQGPRGIDVVLLDIAMPGIDGLEAARRLAEASPHTAVVFCTAYDAHALSAFEAAALDYLVKPVRPERLAAALERVIASADGIDYMESSSAQSVRSVLARTVALRGSPVRWHVPNAMVGSHAGTFSPTVPRSCSNSFASSPGGSKWTRASS